MAARPLGLVFLFGACALLPMCDSDRLARSVAARCELNSDCNNPLSCTYGKCHQTCKATRDCPKGERCIQAEDGNVCQLADETECTYDSDCDSPLKCAVDSICRNACKTTDDCLPAQTCVDGSCAESSDIGSDGHLKRSREAGAGETGGRSGTGGRPGGAGGVSGGAGGATGGSGNAPSGGADAGGDGGSVEPPDASVAPDGSVITDAGDDHQSAAPWHLWIMENTTGHLYGYAPEQLTTTNGDAPEVDIALSDNVSSIHFDASGNLWGVAGGTVVEFAAKDLKKSGTANAIGRFTENAVVGNLTYLALDRVGNLWTSGFNAHGFYRYDRSALGALTSTSVALTPTFKLTTSGVAGIGFDANGDLYSEVNAGGGTANPARFAASQLQGTGSVSDGPVLVMNPRLAFSADIFTSPSGELIVVVGDVYRYKPAQLAMTGTVTAQPDDFTTTGGFGNWGAYDPNGNLWLAADRDKFVFIGPSDLAKTGNVTVTPTVTIRSPVTVSAKFGSLAVR